MLNRRGASASLNYYVSKQSNHKQLEEGQNTWNKFGGDQEETEEQLGLASVDGMDLQRRRRLSSLRCSC